MKITNSELEAASVKILADFLVRQKQITAATTEQLLWLKC